MNIEEQKAIGQEGKQVNPSPQPSPTRGEGVTCHAERRIDPRVSASHDTETLKRVQGDIESCYNTLSRICKFAFCSLTNSTLSQRERVKYGFTLAEVLITLGIIGIVAAMTLPGVISNHKKYVTAQKLKKASTVLLQANRMSYAAEGTADRPGFTPFNADQALEMFNRYYVPYIKFDEVVKGTKGVFGYMQDDMAFYFIKNSQPNSWANTYIIVCTSHKACKNIDEDTIDIYLNNLPNGKDIFTFYTSGSIPNYVFATSTHEQRLDGCKNHTSMESCTALIFEAGWTFPKDYPIGF
ncbi:type II secretion system protein [bacterium]|nr:type II secretion system protein [bacterium]